MTIHVLDQKSEDMRHFDKKEWKQYDLKHFNQPVEWDTKFYYLKAIGDNGEILGTMELKIEGGVGKINTLLVGKNIQRKGVGKSLMQKAEELTKHQNGHKIYLTTGKDWEARKFYESLGYQKSGEINNHFFHIDFIQLSKFL